MKLVKVGARGATAERLLRQLEERRVASSDAALPTVRKIVDGVRRGGDAALRRYAAKFDGLPAKADLRISREEMQRAWEETPAELQNALRSAAKNIRAFAERQLPEEWSFSPVPGLVTG